MVSRGFDKKPEEKGTTPKEQRVEQAQASGNHKYGALSKQPIEGNPWLIFKWIGV